MSYECMWVDSPVGKLRLVAKGDALAAILWENDRPNRVKPGHWRRWHADRICRETKSQAGIIDCRGLSF